MKRFTLQTYQEAKKLLCISLWILCMAEAAAALLDQQNNQLYSTELQSLPTMSIKGIWHTPLQSPENGLFSEIKDLVEQMYSEKTHEFPSNLYKTFGARNKRRRAQNVKVFHLLGIFSRSLKQAERHRQRQREQEEAKIRARHFASNKVRQSSHVLQAMAYTDGTSGFMQQDPKKGNQTSEDNKRTIFVSQGWAPSGGIERDYQNQKAKAKEKSTANINMYAFTSNHWGPLGKRGQPKNKVGLTKSRVWFIPSTVLETIIGASGTSLR